MLTLPPNVRVHLATEPCDMRKSFRGLSGLVRREAMEGAMARIRAYCFMSQSARKSHHLLELNR